MPDVPAPDAAGRGTGRGVVGVAHARRHGAVVGAALLALLAGAFTWSMATAERPDGVDAFRLPGATETIAADVDGSVETRTSVPRRRGTVRVLTDGNGDVIDIAPGGLGSDPLLRSADDVPVTGGLTEVIRRYFGTRTVEAIVIVQCESNFHPDAVGTNTNGTQDHGLFQINDIHRLTFEKVLGRSWDERYDPEVNTAFAAWLHDHADGWGPWSCNDRLAQFDEDADGV